MSDMSNLYYQYRSRLNVLLEVNQDDPYYPEARFEIGCMLYRGLGVSQNDISAFRFFAEAADKGHAEAEKWAEYLEANSPYVIDCLNAQFVPITIGNPITFDFMSRQDEDNLWRESLGLEKEPYHTNQRMRYDQQ